MNRNGSSSENSLSSYGNIENDVLTPFTYQYSASKLQHAKMYLFTIVILPFRVLGVGLFFLLTLLLSNVLTIGYDVRSQTKPICDLRRWLLLPIVCMCARFVFFIGGFHWIKLKGIRATRNEAPILVVAPHSSFLDALVIVALGMPSVVGKTESAESFVGGFFRVLQPILVNREDPNSRKKAIQELIRRAQSKEEWPQIVIFPEGTCTNRSCIATFKSGAFSAGVPVQPVVVRWPNKVDCVTWVCEGPSVLKLLWLAMTQLYNKLEVEFLPVYQPNEDEQLDAELYANNIRRLMAEHLNIPLCDLSYDDFCQIRIACKYKLPAHEAAIYLNSLLQVMFALEHNRDQLSDEDKQAKWLQARLESMLNVCRRKPYLSRTEFTNIVFPTCQPNSKANYLLNLVAKHYTSPLSNKLNFRMCMVHTSMLLFPKLPHQALCYATKAYHLCTLQTGVDDVEAWEISRSDAAELLSFAFTLENDATVQLILDQAYLIRDSIISNNTRSNHSFNGISGDYLYEGLLSQLPDVANCYIYFDTEISKIFGRRRRPLIDSTSASESNLNTVISAPAIQMTNSLAAVNDTSIKSQKDLILTNFECIDITEVPLKESNCYADKIKDDIHLINNSLKDDLSINFRGRYSERGV